MRIVILTSKDHIYANIILNGLINQGVLDNHSVTVLEQDSIVPNKSMFEGLKKYLAKAGPYYVTMQVTKQYLFKIVRFFALVTKNVKSLYYPYYHNHRANLVRRTLNHISKPENINYIKKLKPDTILSLYSKEIIPQSIFSIPKYGAINLHPALLPSYRGVSPIFWCLVNNELKSGVTLHYVDNGIDTGSIISQAEVKTANITTEHQLYVNCTRAGLNLLEFYIDHPGSLPKYVNHELRKPSYNSIPTKIAVDKFRTNNYKFFTLKEFIQ